ncbi:hypothetical protein CTI12_AA611000 [Artemisia annua]|uniref:C3H1-type domain-containing protein n=1 Tax=Artemisia annua TaxID=35608 RepID=A0A2U1KES9_ARTAN|nr:hypothetical protein CTI12_AA611000 [Artemisia annua]
MHHLVLPIPSGANLMISSRCGSSDPYVTLYKSKLSLHQVLQRIYGTILKHFFHDNKDARAINLDNELRSIKIGNMTINEYCTKIKSMADRLKNLGSPVSEKNLVIYAVNGLDSRFATIVKIIRHREPLPSFATARNMLLLEESTLKEQTNSPTTFDSTSSSPTILLASNSSGHKGTSNATLPQLCNHFSKGTCKFGDRCKFIHDHRHRIGLKNNTTYHQLGRGNGKSSYSSPIPLPIHDSQFSTILHVPGTHPTSPP